MWRGPISVGLWIFGSPNRIGLVGIGPELKQRNGGNGGDGAEDRCRCGNVIWACQRRRWQGSRRPLWSRAETRCLDWAVVIDVRQLLVELESDRGGALVDCEGWVVELLMRGQRAVALTEEDHGG
ncbi:hypothetical protein M0R45_020190 [Rubus argutus]|uniref:Uncharacterized protein n=1 Tax=Rubus argutus TaxID=59490 RepID=A0AAW1X9A8_RUBAR